MITQVCAWLYLSDLPQICTKQPQTPLIPPGKPKMHRKRCREFVNSAHLSKFSLEIREQANNAANSLFRIGVEKTSAPVV